MLNWQHIIFRSLIYIGILSPFVFIACFVIICISQYLKQKSEKIQEVSNMEKKYKEQIKSKYATLTDITSESSTQSLWRKTDNPNQQPFRIDKTQSEMSSSIKDSLKQSFVNVPDERYFKYSDSMSLLSEEGRFENTSENEMYDEDLSHSQNRRDNFQEELISPKLNKSKRIIQSKCRDIQQNTTFSDNSKRKQCKCNSDYKKSYTIQDNSTKQDHFIGNSNFDDTSLNIDPVEVVRKVNGRRVQVCDKEFEISPLKNVSDNQIIETDNILDHQLQQCSFENDQGYRVKPRNKSSQGSYEKCPTCTVSKEKRFVPEIQETEYFPYGRYNSEEINKHHKDFRIPVFQNSNIPIAKRVLEEDQFYDLRQKFYSAENTFQNASKPTKYELNFNTWNKDSKLQYKADGNSHSSKVQKIFEEGNIKDAQTQHTVQVINVTEETGNENQTENVSSTCDSTEKEELLCQFWKSLKTEGISQKKHKAIQTEVPHVGQHNTELMLQKYANETNDHFKQKSQKGKQDATKQDTTAKKNGLSNIQDQITQTNLNEKQYIPRESSQSEVTEFHPKVKSISTQVSDDMRNIKNRMYTDCQNFLPSADYSEEKIKTDAIKPMALYSRPRMMQTEFQHPCHKPFQLGHAQLTKDTNSLHCNDCYFRPNFTTEHENVYNRYNADYDLQNKCNYVCNPIISMNCCENKQSLNSFNNDTRLRQIQKMYPEQGSMPLNNPCIHFVQSEQDKYKYRTPTTEKVIYYKNGYTQQQMENKQLLNHELGNKMPVTAHQCMPNYNSANNFYSQPIFWNNENVISQENEFYDKNIDIQREDNLMQAASHNSRNNRSKMHDKTETDVKAVQTSEETVLISSNHEKECNQQISKEREKISNSKIETDRKQVSEKSSAEQNHKKENVVRQIRKMYPQIDQNIHETNKNVIIQVKSFLQKKGKWQSENN